MAYTLQLLHASDLEGGVEALVSAPNFAAIIDHFRENAAADVNTLTISAGDNYIPGPFFNTAADFSMGQILTDAMTRYYTEVLQQAVPDGLLDLGRGAGRVDVSIMNVIEFDASAVGNHEFDPGTNAFASIIEAEGADGVVEWIGANFPYLTSNIDFSGDSSLAVAFTDQILANTEFTESLTDIAAGNQNADIAAATIIERGGEQIGVVGATTQIIETISSTGGANETTGGANDMAALAATIQPQIDALRAQGINKIIVTSHLQQIALEKELATLLEGVDIIIAGGSDTLQADTDDRLRDGDTAAEAYPFVTSNADGDPVVVVSTAGEYSYVGRLVVEFDDNGVLQVESIDTAVSGAYATDDQGVLDVTGEATIEDAINNSTRADIVEDLTSAVETIVEANDGITFGFHDVFLDGRRETVRTEESNLGNLTADANLAEARMADDTVTISFKNGGGIRSEIGSSDNTGTNAGDGQLSLLDLQNSLRFNNDLTLVTVTSAGLLMLLEHAVAETDTDAGNTPGRFPQVAGLRFSFDERNTGQVLATDADGNYIVDPATGLPQIETEGSRIQTVALVDPVTGEETIIVQNGELTSAAPASVRMVTLDFLVENNGDGYPFQEIATDIEYVTFTDGTYGTTADEAADNILEEQDALGNYFEDNFATEDDAFNIPETDINNDRRIIQIAQNGENDFIADAIGEPTVTATISANLLSGETEQFTGGSEVVAYDSGAVYVTNGAQSRIDVFDADGGAKIREIDLSGIADYDGVQSVAVSNGIVAAAVARTPSADNPTASQNGGVALLDTLGNALGEVEVGNLPDSLVFTPDGTKILVANEGEPTDLDDPNGGVSIIEVNPGDPANSTVTTLDFTAFDGMEDQLREQGIFIEPGRSASEDLEPEYIAVTPDGTTAWVVLQEANAYAVVDLATNTISELRSFGAVDRSQPGFEIDASNRDDAINLQNYDNLFGLRQPDAIAAKEINGETYFFTANEGDARDATEARVADLVLDEEAFGGADAVAQLQLDENLGRLNVRTDIGDIDGDGDYDRLYHYGSRSFTIYNAAGDVVFESGSEFSRIIAEIRPDLFNTSDGETADGRSDDKGVEPEAIVVGEVEGRTLAFIGLERDSGIMIYDVSDPANAFYVNYIDSSVNGNISPETIAFIPAEESSSGFAQIAVAYEGDGNTVIYDIDDTTIQSDGESVEVTSEVETIDLGSRANAVLRGDPANFNGDTISGFGSGDSFMFTGDVVDSILFDPSTNILTVDGNIINLANNTLSGGEFFAFEIGGETSLSYENLLPTLTPGVRVDASNINGINNQEYLESDGSTNFEITVRDLGQAGFNNSIGVYEIDASGNIVDVSLLFNNANASFGESTTLTGVEDGNNLGFFIVQNAASWADGLSATDTLTFVDSAGNLATTSDGVLSLHVNGVDSGQTAFHSFTSAFNSDGVQHALSGVSNNTMTVGFEDLTGGGDSDYEDVGILINRLDIDAIA